MKDLKIVYSLNTYPITHNRWGMGNRLQETIYMTAASILYTCLRYEEIMLYVDPIGYEYLSFLPCEVIETSFDSDIDLWVEPKFYSMRQQNDPFIHLDNDIFLKQPMDFTFDNVLVERKDDGYRHYKELIQFFDRYSDDLSFWNPNIPFAWSCGVMGFMDLELRDEFISVYENSKKVLYRNQKDYKEYSEQHGYLEINLLLEQYNLTSLLDCKGIKPKTLISGNNRKEQSEYANSIGYVHLLGASKYHEKNKQKIEHNLITKFPNHYKRLKRQMEKIN